MKVTRVYEFLDVLRSESKVFDPSYQDNCERRRTQNIFNEENPIKVNLDSPESFMKFFKKERVGVDIRDLYTYRNDQILNDYCRGTLMGKTKASKNYLDIALMIHSLVHIHIATNSFSSDSVLDLALSHMLYGPSESQEFFVDIYSMYSKQKFYDPRSNDRFQTTYNISIPFFRAFVKFKKGVSIFQEQEEIESLIQNHLRINSELGLLEDSDNITSSFRIDNDSTKVRFRTLMSQIIPGYERIIRI